jgi:hypothetical protein
MAIVTNFKGDRPSGKVQRRLRTLERDNAEDRAKAEVRRRDKGCRFPGCGCRRMRLSLEVSHKEHKGAGGNPAGDRSAPELMVQVCRERHKANPFSIDRGTIAWEPVSKRAGANGQIVWRVDVALLRYYMEGGRRPDSVRLVEVARETAVGAAWAEVVPQYAWVIEALSGMTW